MEYVDSIDYEEKGYFVTIFELFEGDYVVDIKNANDCIVSGFHGVSSEKESRLIATKEIVKDKATHVYHNIAAESIDGTWNEFSLNDWVLNVENQKPDDSYNPQCLRVALLDYFIEKANKCTYGASCDYELFEERKQAEIETLLLTLSLSDDKKRIFKEKTGFIEESSPYEMICEKCGTKDSAFASAKSIEIEAMELCKGCLHDILA